MSYIRGVKWLLLLFNAMSAAMVVLRPDFMAPSCMCVQVMNICDNDAIYNQSRKKIKTLGRLGPSPRVNAEPPSAHPAVIDLHLSRGERDLLLSLLFSDCVTEWWLNTSTTFKDVDNF